jgi:protein SCO1/2
MKHALFALLLISFACSQDVKPEARPLSEPGEKLYDVRGVILSRNGDANSLNLDHEAIPGFMEAMKMDYTVRGAAVSTLPPDQTRIEAKLHVMPTSYWITDVKKVP